MRLLVLGGTVFLGRAVVRHAVAAGHDVTCAARGDSGDPPDGARFVRIDRADPDGLAALDGDFDAVVDVARHPSHVRHAVDALAGRVGHYSFVSTISVYRDSETIGQGVDAPVFDPAPDGDDDPTASPEAYGACKIRCEQLVTDAFGAENVFICRAGLIVGPEDQSGRFDYWVTRADRGGEVLVVEPPDAPVQIVDVRDLAAWMVSAGERRRSGVYDGIGPIVPRDEFLAALIGDRATLTWVSQEFLWEREKVAPWSGPRSLPVMLPVPEVVGLLAHDAAPALAAGLRPRPLAETVADTLAWLNTGAGTPNGLTEAEEAELLAAWHARS
jgi:nucleoside-diphosphate-sugar epimerase